MCLEERGLASQVAKHQASETETAGRRRRRGSMLQGLVELQLLVNSQGAGASPSAFTDGWQDGGGGHLLLLPACFSARGSLWDKAVTPMLTFYAVTLFQWRFIMGEY